MVTLWGSVRRMKSWNTLYHPRFHSGSQGVNKQQSRKLVFDMDWGGGGGGDWLAGGYCT